MTEVWGWCRPCGRWFYLGRESTGGPCPVCGVVSELVMVRERGAAAKQPADHL